MITKGGSEFEAYPLPPTRLRVRGTLYNPWASFLLSFFCQNLSTKNVSTNGVTGVVRISGDGRKAFAERRQRQRRPHARLLLAAAAAAALVCGIEL